MAEIDLGAPAEHTLGSRTVGGDVPYIAETVRAGHHRCRPSGYMIMVRKEVAAAPIWFVVLLTVAIWFVVLLTVAIQLPHLFSLPRTSDDAYRYIWDGRVLLSGIDPYSFVPMDSALAGLRDPTALPGG